MPAGWHDSKTIGTVIEVLRLFFELLRQLTRSRDSARDQLMAWYSRCKPAIIPLITANRLFPIQFDARLPSRKT